MLLVPDSDLALRNGTGLLTLSCGTDNLGNTFLLDRLLTTKYPLGVVLMEVAFQCRKRNLVLRANWVPRLENQEADDLTNMEFKSFDPRRRLAVDLDSLKFGVLDRLFAEGDRYVAELAELKAMAASTAASGRERRHKKMQGETLRERDQW